LVFGPGTALPFGRDQAYFPPNNHPAPGRFRHFTTYGPAFPRLEMNTVTQAGPACYKEMKKKLSHVVKPLFILYNEA